MKQNKTRQKHLNEITQFLFLLPLWNLRGETREFYRNINSGGSLPRCGPCPAPMGQGRVSSPEFNLQHHKSKKQTRKLNRRPWSRERWSWRTMKAESREAPPFLFHPVP
jgi:hypothetical protein